MHRRRCRGRAGRCRRGCAPLHLRDAPAARLREEECGDARVALRIRLVEEDEDEVEATEQGRGDGGVGGQVGRDVVAAFGVAARDYRRARVELDDQASLCKKTDNRRGEHRLGCGAERVRQEGEKARTWSENVMIPWRRREIRIRQGLDSDRGLD